MKIVFNRRSLLILAGSALLTGLAALLWLIQGKSWPQVLAFPFAQAGELLRELSLSGDSGNALAIALYLVICLLPIVIRLCFIRRRRLIGADALLVLLAAVLFLVLYYMINPRLALARGAGTVMPVLKAVLGGCVYAVLAGYVVLVFLHAACSADNRGLYRLFGGLALFTAIPFVLIGGYSLVTAFATLPEALPDRVVRIFSGFAGAIPYFLCSAAVLVLSGLLACLESEADGVILTKYAATLTALCRAALIVTLSLTLAGNLMQLLLIASLSDVSISLSLPLVPLLLVLLILLLARFVSENRSLRAENDLFV